MINQLDFLDFIRATSSDGFERRQYQVDALDAIEESLRAGRNPVCNIPTGGGKGYIIAELCRRLEDKRILVATHRKELLRQNEQALLRVGEDDTGVYSAGLGRRETDARVIFGGIQSVYHRVKELQEAGRFDLVIVDEAHLVAPPSEKSMYRRVMAECLSAQRAGFTATPYRLKDGVIYGDGNKFSCVSSSGVGRVGHWFDHLAVDISIQELTSQGYLSPLVGVETAANVNTNGIPKQAGEFAKKPLSEAASEERVIDLALDEIFDLAWDRHSWLLFCVDVAHTIKVHEALCRRGVDAEYVVGKTKNRDEIFERFKKQDFRALVGCEVFTTGFDAPCVDMVGVLRPTMSMGLFVQMVGRGTRLSPWTFKEDCLLLDLAGNLERHQPLDGVPNIKRSERREEALAQEEREAKVRAERERKVRHGVKAWRGNPFGEANKEGKWLDVVDVLYMVKPASRREGANNLMVVYKCRQGDGVVSVGRNVTSWVCLEYPSGRARTAAEAWFQRRNAQMPPSAEIAQKVAWYYPKPNRILVKRQNGWDRVEGEEFDA